MTLFILAYAAGLLTIASPCIFPILPIILARADQPFRRSGLPLLIGLTLTFAVAASLASVAGNWAIEANRYGRTIALIVMTLFGLALLLPTLATRLMAPLVLLGVKLSGWAGQTDANANRTPVASLLLGIATGLVWAPCAGPVLGLILTGAALHGPGIDTVLLLLAYGLGAATSLAAGMLLGGRLLTRARELMPWSDGVRRALGGAVVLGAIAIWAGLDTRLLTQLSLPSTTAFESKLIDTLQPAPSAQAGTSVGNATARATLSGPLASIVGSRQWLNTSPLKTEDLQGKVVLVNFWTYSCINCLRVLPHVRAWAEKYKDKGLVVIGVHAPEFPFEKRIDNVRRAVKEKQINYPVAIDNEHRIWRAFDNSYWPALYFIDARGRVRHHHFGEGSYEQSEKFIQDLLAEAGAIDIDRMPVSVAARGLEAAADWSSLQSGENYVGYERTQNFASPGGLVLNTPLTYQSPARMGLNQWALSGDWMARSDAVALNKPNGGIAYRFHARDLHLVMGPATPGTSIRFRMLIDGKPPGEAHGIDVDEQGNGNVTEQRLYQLVSQPKAVIDRQFEIEFLDPGVEAFAFTFS